MIQRLVDPKLHVPRSLGVRQRHVGNKVQGVSKPGGEVELVGGGEVIEGERVGLERGVGEKAARVERVIAGELVGERLPLHQHSLALVLKPGSECQPQQDSHQRKVEHQVRRLPKISALGRNTGALDLHPVASFPQCFFGGSQ